MQVEEAAERAGFSNCVTFTEECVNAIIAPWRLLRK